MNNIIKVFILVCAVGAIGTASAQTPEVKIKKGKATMDEAYYYQLKQKAAAYNDLVAKQEENTKNLEEAQKKLKRYENIKIVTFNDSASYAIGKDIALNWQQQNLGIRLDVVALSLLDMVNGTNTWDRGTMQPLLQRFQRQFEEREMKKHNEQAEQNKAEGAKFLQENANNKSVYTTKSGLQYKIIKKGNGNRPKATSTVQVHYTGTLINGKKFDSSRDRGKPAEFGVNMVIPGWTEALQLMDEGSHYILYIPAELAYGDQAAGDIPPGSTLIFDVELIKIIKK